MPTKAPAGPGMKPENRGCVFMSSWYIYALLNLHCRFAYVDFATVEAKMAAIALSRKAPTWSQVAHKRWYGFPTFKIRFNVSISSQVTASKDDRQPLSLDSSL